MRKSAIKTMRNIHSYSPSSDSFIVCIQDATFECVTSDGLEPTTFGL
jgi:hypothetical protein